MNKLLIVILVLALAACGNSKKNKAGSTNAEDITLTGAGATFPLPYYNLAFPDDSYSHLSGSRRTGL